MSSALQRKLQLYAHLTATDLGQLSDALRQTRLVNARIDIAVEGDDPRTVYVILHGWAGRCRYLPDGRRQITSLLLPAIAATRTSSCSVGATTPSPP